LTQNVNSQDKVIKGDTSFWYSWNQELLKKLELANFNKSHADFSFRFRNHRQVIEIFKTNNQIYGELTNYIYHSVKKREKTLMQKTKLDSAQSTNVYAIIENTGILTLESDNKINGWSQGADGTTYIIEHSNEREYWYKNYWTPSAQHSIPESLIVMNFVKAISDTLQLPQRYKDFKDSLPHRGCYNSGGMVTTCYASNSFGLGYNGSTRLPVGFVASLNLAYVGEIRTNFGLRFQYKCDRNGNHETGINTSKSDIFIRGSKTYDFLQYDYWQRELDFLETNIVFHNHQFRYGISIKNGYSFSTGINYMIDDKEKIGGNFSVSKWFTKPAISTTLTSSIFEDDFDYKIGISKSIYFNSRFILRDTSIGFYFENFQDYNDLNINVTFWL
jgi:hypothetical protein